MKLRRTFLKTAAAAFTLSLATPAVVQAKDPIPVVATFSILGDMVSRIGGDHVALTTLVGPDGDSHVYRPTPADARAVSGAQVLFVNGLEFEGWIDRLVDASDFSGTRVVATMGIDPIPFEDGHDDHGHEEHAEHKHDEHKHDHAEHKHDEHKHDHAEHKHDEHKHDHAEHKHDEHKHDHAEHKHDEHKHDHAEHKHDEHKHDHAEHKHDDHAHDAHAGHDHGEFDPHAWQSLTLAVAYVDNITAALAKADPANAADYYKNRETYVAEINALDAEIKAMIAQLPENRRTVVTSHDAFQYFGRDYGLTFLAPQGMSTESEASARDVAELIEHMREENISAVFIEKLTDSRMLERIASETGASIGGTLYPGALSKADGPAPTYLDMMRHNARTLSQALGS